MTIKLTIKYDATHELWFTHSGETEDDSRWIGQGRTPEDACSDYWWQAHKSVAELVSGDDGCWKLEQDSWSIEFSSKQEAVDYANAHEWQVKGRSH